ncbi:zinc finger MYM-type protein 1-like, partial [Myzus persicae]|uniref:zinc finger MYM-type protein 1-like n=1 Tax=Myzus persicae TaxID=13164 RepID=UPI000B933E78
QPLPNELPNKKFPIDAQGRSFHENWYWKKLPNGDVSRRKWLSYSKKQNKAYCLYCVLFGRNEQTNWIKEGFHFWKNGPNKIIIHETSEAHIMASIKAAYKEASFPLLPSLQENAVSNVLLNREIIRHLIDLTLFLGRHCLSFRGHKEGWQEELCGNFKDLTKLLAKYSPALSSYITQLQIKGRKMHSFLSWQRQNQLIQAISTNIRDTIQKELLSSVFFSVSLDTTYDISRKEQLSIVLRYINKKNGIVCERLVAVRETVLTSGQHLFTMFVDICKEMNLNWKQNLVGQSYDGAASMRGAYNGLQSIIKTHNPSATYVWCWAHRISLVVVDAVSSCVEARDLFGNLETLYDYVGSSKKRGGLYSDYQKVRYPGKSLRRLKRVSTTRWSSHSSALLTVFDTYDALIDLLHYLQTDSSSDRVCSVKAKSLLDYLLSERFILTGLTFKKIFDLVNPLSKLLQGKNIDLLNAVSYVKFVLKRIQELRSETQFKIIVNEKNKFLESKFNHFYMIPLTEIRTRRIKKMPGEKAPDDQPLISPIDNFKIKTYYVVIDIVCTQVAERFNEHSTPLFKDISLFQKKRLKEVAEPNNLRLPVDAFNAFEQVYGKFVSAVNLRREYLQFANTFFEFEKLVKLPEKLHHDFTDVLNSDDNEDQDTDEDSFGEHEKSLDTIHMLFEVCNRSELKNIFPSLYTALCIALTLPVSSASPERAFSKLKLIKTRLRSTMCEERLESLMVISCEKDIPIDTDEVIKCFSSYSSVLLKLLT